MTDITNLPRSVSPETILIRLVEHHGAWSTIRALSAVLLRRRRQRPRTAALPDHLRRDIGLPERGSDPPPLRDPWL
jgi:hypothetical protein